MAPILKRILLVLRKDLRLEWRRRARLFSVLLFGLVVLLMFSFAIRETDTLGKASGGLLVLALLLSSTLALNESFRSELEDRALEGLLLLPIGATALFYGKALANTILLFLLGPLLLPIALVLYDVELAPARVPALLGVLLLAAAGLAAPGTLYAGMTARMTSQDVLQPILLFPLVTPLLLGSVKSLTLLIAGDPMSELSSWVTVLVAFDVIYWVLCGVLFPFVVEAEG
jgi:heme exporter protein B